MVVRLNNTCEHFRHLLNLHKQHYKIEGTYNVNECKCMVCFNASNHPPPQIFSNSDEWLQSSKNKTQPPLHTLVKQNSRNSSSCTTGTVHPGSINYNEIPSKIIVFGDIHRDVIGFLAALEDAGVITCGLERVKFMNGCVEDIVVVCCGDMIDGHRPTGESRYIAGNIREEMDLFQMIEYLNGLEGLRVLCTAGNHEVMRSENDNTYMGKQVYWDRKDLSKDVAYHFPLIITIGNCVFSHSLPNKLHEFCAEGYHEKSRQENGLQYLNKLFFNFMLDTSKNLQNVPLLYSVLWDRDIVNYKNCGGLDEYTDFLGCKPNSIFFIGHTKPDCKAHEVCNKNIHVELCHEHNNYRVHAMDTHWPLAFMNTSRDTQSINYAVVTNINKTPLVKARVCRLKMQPQQKPQPALTI